MSARTLRCEQAVFTSTRIPTGEGYRIIASSRGLRTDVKRVITRCSPSQNALCWSPDADDADRYAVAFYPASQECLCVAHTCYAGAEQSGRGGERVYTLNLVFNRSDFGVCGYNPFTVVRAMVASGLAEPLLKPPPVLAPMDLRIDERPGDIAVSDVSPAFDPEWRAYLLRALEGNQPIVVNLPEQWLAAAECLLLGLPGERRAEVSFCAGLRYSVSRPHRLSFVADEGGQARLRMTGRAVELIEPLDRAAPETPESLWLSFVMRHWRTGDTAGLARRTAISLRDASPETCERIGRMYNAIDGMRKLRTAELLATAASHLRSDTGDAESDIAAELVVTAQDALLKRFTVKTWDDVRDLWPRLCLIWRQSSEGRLFAKPLLERALDAPGTSDPAGAAEAALDLAQGTEAGALSLDPLVERVLTRALEWTENAPAAELVRLETVCHRWRTVRPRCSIVSQLVHRCRRTETAEASV